MLMTDAAGPPPPTRVLAGGDHAAPEQEVEPGFPAIFVGAPGGTTEPVVATATPRTSGRRLALADWIASPANRTAAKKARRR